jgi:hypothetical protein
VRTPGVGKGQRLDQTARFVTDRGSTASGHLEIGNMAVAEQCTTVPSPASVGARNSMESRPPIASEDASASRSVS